jgi:hypothetical protein
MRLRSSSVQVGVSVVSLVALASFLSPSGVPRAQGTFEVVASGLDNPRGLAFGPEGALYVAEAGSGGDGTCIPSPGSPPGTLRCYGPTGAITRIWRGTQERVATGLPSLATAAGEAVGPHDISFQGRGGAYVTIGLGGDPTTVRSALGPAGALFGTLIHVAASGQWKAIADISAHEALENPAGGPIDTNPYGLLAEPGARIIADAGANTLLRLEANGGISTLAMFPSRPARPTDAVPTAVVRGPDGAYYVSQLTGVPFTDGAANIFRVVPGGSPEVFLVGFKTVIDLDFGPDGSLYVLQHATGPVFFGGPGRVIRVAPDGTRTIVAPAVALSRPTSIVVGADGAVYVSNKGTSVGTGEVLRIEP